MDLSKSGRASPEHLKTPMVIELNADDSDISPLQNLPRDQAAAEDFELGKIKFYIKDNELSSMQAMNNHQKDF